MATDRYQGLRDALAAGPTKGKWRADTEGKPDSDMNHGVIAEINDLWIAAMYRSGTTTDGDDKTPEAEAEAAANARYVAAADPGTIAALLAELDALREARKSSLLVLCALRDANDWHPNMVRDIDFAIAANRAALADGEASNAG